MEQLQRNAVELQLYRNQIAKQLEKGIKYIKYNINKYVMDHVLQKVDILVFSQRIKDDR